MKIGIVPVVYLGVSPLDRCDQTLPPSSDKRRFRLATACLADMGELKKKGCFKRLGCLKNSRGSATNLELSRLNVSSNVAQFVRPNRDDLRGGLFIL